AEACRRYVLRRVQKRLVRCRDVGGDGRLRVAVVEKGGVSPVSEPEAGYTPHDPIGPTCDGFSGAAAGRNSYWPGCCRCVPPIDWPAGIAPHLADSNAHGQRGHRRRAGGGRKDVCPCFNPPIEELGRPRTWPAGIPCLRRAETIGREV